MIRLTWNTRGYNWVRVEADEVQSCEDDLKSAIRQLKQGEAVVMVDFKANLAPGRVQVGTDKDFFDSPEWCCGCLQATRWWASLMWVNWHLSDDINPFNMLVVGEIVYSFQSYNFRDKYISQEKTNKKPFWVFYYKF